MREGGLGVIMNDIADEIKEALDPFAAYRSIWDHFDKKTHGRIWVLKQEYISRVDAVIKELDEFEHSYLPSEFIAVYEGDLLDLEYGHKFEMGRTLLTQACMSIGIWIVCVTGHRR